MTGPLTPATLDELERLHAAATPGEWIDVGYTDLWPGVVMAVSDKRYVQVCVDPEADDRPADLACIAALHSAAPALIAAAREVEALRAERDEARAELERLRAFVPRWEPAGSLGAMCLRLGTVALASIARDWSGLWLYRAEVERRDFPTADACARAVCARLGIPYVPVQEQP